MAEEKKKKGFWSWLGFGKKDEPEVQEETTISEEPTESRSELQFAPTNTENQTETVGANDIRPEEIAEQAVEIEEISANTEIKPSESRGELQFAQTNAENQPETVGANDTRPEDTAEQAVEIEEISANTEIEQAEPTISEELTHSAPACGGSPCEAGVGGSAESEMTAIEEKREQTEQDNTSVEIEVDLPPTPPTAVLPPQAGAELSEQAVEIEENAANSETELVGANDTRPEDTAEQAVEIEEISVNTEIEQAEPTISEELTHSASACGGSPCEAGVGGCAESEMTAIEEKREQTEQDNTSVEIEVDLPPTPPEAARSPQAGAELSEQAVEIEENSANSETELVEANNIRPEETVEQAVEIEEISAKSTEAETQEKPSEGGFFSRLIKGLIKTKQNIGSGFRNLFRGKKIDDELFEELEEQLLIADLGMPTTTKIIKNLTEHATKAQLRDAELLYQQLKVELGEVLKPVAQPLVVEPKKPYVILMVGVNGVGKTTTIGKLARKFQSEGKSVMLAAGDTFRAAAVEQLQVWGERNGIPVVAQATGSDSASVIFDAMQSAAAKGVDVLIADTAGRLQNKNNLMDELKKIVRVMKKYDETAPHEIMLTLDAGTGQNAISQAKLFNEAVGLTGITLTKLDGTAKGGVIFAIADQFNIPIRFIGVGEKIDDLRPFNAEEFIEALFTHEDEK